MRTPREVFIASPHATGWKSVCNSEVFDPACIAALAELQSQMPSSATPGVPTDPYVGIDANAQMFGARRVLAILAGIAEPIKQPEPIKRPSLKY